jgi:hypothetical protein
MTMSTYETTATVENQGQIRVSGLPFEVGTKVDVTVTPAHNGADSRGRAAQLLAALDNARNCESVGPLRRAELYDRDILH